MKGDVLADVLRFIGERGIAAVDLASAVLDSGYGASQGKINKKTRENQKERERKLDEFKAKRRYAVMLHRLRSQGLISEKIDESKGKKFFSLTTKGSIKLRQFKENKANSFPVPSYNKEISNNFVIITFDVPEESRRKRAWLRSALKNIGLSMLQKSVWIGKVKIPGEFIDDLAQLKLIDYVEVLEITKTGSLKRLG